MAGVMVVTASLLGVGDSSGACLADVVRKSMAYVKDTFGVVEMEYPKNLFLAVQGVLQPATALKKVKQEWECGSPKP
jgi:hypothetical protein